jgi:hypothetical protein
MEGMGNTQDSVIIGITIIPLSSLEKMAGLWILSDG